MLIVSCEGASTFPNVRFGNCEWESSCWGPTSVLKANTKRYRIPACEGEQTTPSSGSRIFVLGDNSSNETDELGAVFHSSTSAPQRNIKNISTLPTADGTIQRLCARQFFIFCLMEIEFKWRRREIRKKQTCASSQISLFIKRVQLLYFILQNTYCSLNVSLINF